MNNLSSFTTNRKTHIIVGDRDYVNSHGKSPRGTGLWAFELEWRYGDGSTKTEARMSSPTMSLASAIKEVKDDIKRTTSILNVWVQEVRINIQG